MANGDRQLHLFLDGVLDGPACLLNNMQNLGIYNVAKDGLADMGIDINELEDMESGCGLRQWRLRPLAACFMDSDRLLRLSQTRQHHPLRIWLLPPEVRRWPSKSNLPDQWLSNGFVFEVRKPKHAVEVKFYGNAETYLRPNGDLWPYAR
jgi:starch phosphorylase